MQRASCDRCNQYPVYALGRLADAPVRRRETASSATHEQPRLAWRRIRGRLGRRRIASIVVAAITKHHALAVLARVNRQYCARRHGDIQRRAAEAGAEGDMSIAEL